MKKAKNWISRIAKVFAPLGFSLIYVVLSFAGFLIYADLIGAKIMVIFVIFLLYIFFLEYNKGLKKIENDVVALLQESDERRKNAEKPSYKLSVRIEPNWFNIYKIASGDKSEKEIIKEISAKAKKTVDKDANLYGRQYLFTEYYDSLTGLTSRFQRVILPSKKQLTDTVEEFGDRGYFYKCDDDIVVFEMNEEKRREYQYCEKLKIEIGENYIRNNGFNGYQYKSESEYRDDDYLFRFPLHDIFNLFLAKDKSTSKKWQDSIFKKFKELGMRFETHLDGELKSFGTEENGKEFFDEWAGELCWYNLVSKDGTRFIVDLKIFRPGENKRMSDRN